MPDDPTRRESHPLTPQQIETVDELKSAGNELIAMIDGLGERREFALAKTKIEEAVMWAVKGVTAP